ncbi:MAG: hypothetical protein RLZZ219_576, partial [Cyanobacteriota bacterium]
MSSTRPGAGGPASAPPLLQLEALSVRYGSVQAVTA